MKKQIGYELDESYYLSGLLDALIWYLSNQNKHCESFCPNCQFFYKCQDDMMREWLNQ